MTGSAPSAPSYVVRGWHVALGVGAFFAVVVGVDAVFLTLAYRTHPGQVAAKPYEAGLLYNAELDRLRLQDALGWRVGATAAPGSVLVVVHDRDGRPLEHLAITADLQRPATERGREALSLQEGSPGRYRARHALSGAWDLRIEARDPEGRTVLADRRLTWP